MSISDISPPLDGILGLREIVNGLISQPYVLNINYCCQISKSRMGKQCGEHLNMCTGKE